MLAELHWKQEFYKIRGQIRSMQNKEKDKFYERFVRYAAGLHENLSSIILLYVKKCTSYNSL